MEIVESHYGHDLNEDHISQTISRVWDIGALLISRTEHKLAQNA